VLYVCDYALTITCARLYRRSVNEKLVFEGSYETTPLFQKDVDSLRRLSPRFIAALILCGNLLAGSWLLSAQSQPELYEFLLGVMILVQVSIHTRHGRNLFLFRAMNKTDEVRGRIEYSRSLLLRMSSVEHFIFSALYLILFAFTQSWFIFGGAVGCLSLAAKHRSLARKRLATAPAAVQSPQGMESQRGSSAAISVAHDQRANWKRTHYRLSACNSVSRCARAAFSAATVNAAGIPRPANHSANWSR
jgi:hypothetical protein